LFTNPSALPRAPTPFHRQKLDSGHRRNLDSLEAAATDTKIIDLPAYKPGKVSVADHMAFFEDPKVRQQVLDEINRRTSKYTEIRTDELEYTRKR
jgi:hypothetical protein